MDFFGCEAEREILVFGSGKLFFWFMYFCCILSVPYHFPFTDTTLKTKSLYIKK